MGARLDMSRSMSPPRRSMSRDWMGWKVEVQVRLLHCHCRWQGYRIRLEEEYVPESLFGKELEMVLAMGLENQGWIEV